MQDQLTVLSPVSERSGIRKAKISSNTLPAPLPSLRITLLSNHKHNVDNLFAGITDVLGLAGFNNVKTFDKGTASRAVSDDMFQEALSGTEILLTAMADWGSCTSWTVHDAVQFERAGIPTFVITTDAFISLGLVEAKALGVEKLRFEQVPHPLGGLEAETARERGRTVARRVIEILNNRD